VDASGSPLEIAVEVRGWPATLHLAARGAGVAVVNDVCEV